MKVVCNTVHRSHVEAIEARPSNVGNQSHALMYNS